MGKTHQDHVKPLHNGYLGLHGFHSFVTVVRKENKVSVLLEHLRRHFLIDLIIFGKENSIDLVRNHVLWISHIRLKCRDKSGGKVWGPHRCSDGRADAVVETPFHYKEDEKEG